MKRTILTLATALALLVAGLFAPLSAPVRGQDDGPRIDPLFEFSLLGDDLPNEPVFVRLLRIRMEPGANSPLHTHPGPELWRIEKGVLTLFVQGGANLKRAGEDTFAEAPESTEFELNEGDQIVILPGTAMTFTNKSDAEARLLASVILPAGNQRPPGITYVDEEPDEDAFEGIRSTILGDGVAALLPSGDATVRLERLRLNAGQAIPAESNPVLLTSTRGGLDFTLVSGAAQVTRTEQPGPQSNAEPGGEFTLETGDAVFFPYGMVEAQRSENDADIQMYRLTIIPAGDGATPVAAGDPPAEIDVTGPAAPEEEPAEVAPSTPEPEATEEPEEEATEEPDTEAGRFEEGATVYVVDVDVRLRSGPSTEAEIVSGLETGQALVVTGPPEEGNDITWWPVASPDDPSFAGYVADQFLSDEPPG